MANYEETIERTEDGAFIVKLVAEDGSVIAEAQADSYEEALETAQAKI
jgi:predicted RNase H-like HicB family nuclease